MAHLGHGTHECCSSRGRDLVERARDRRVRGDRAEQMVAGSQELDVEAALATTRQHERALHEHLAAVVHRDPCAGPRQARRECIAE